MASVKRHTVEDAVRTVGQMLSDRTLLLRCHAGGKKTIKCLECFPGQNGIKHIVIMI